VGERSERKGSLRNGLRWSALAWLTVILLWLSTVLYGATSVGWIGPNEPSRGDDLQQYLRAYLLYRHDLLRFEQVENWCLAAALLALVVLVWRWSAAAIARGHEPTRAVAVGVAFGIGRVVAAVTQVAYLGAEVRVLAVIDVPSSTKLRWPP
jgi:hypothetical protein